MTDDPLTCGEGLAEQARLPAALADLVTSVAAILAFHKTALDRGDAASNQEYQLYDELARQHERAASHLSSLATSMAAARDLPMGPHDEPTMMSAEAVSGFQRYVSAEQELLAMLKNQVERDQVMLAEMRSAGRHRRA